MLNQRLVWQQLVWPWAFIPILFWLGICPQYFLLGVGIDWFGLLLLT